jgi:hypothetical protein
MLGGDNMDLTLARTVEPRLGGGRLNAGELSQLLQQCRGAKERLLADRCAGASDGDGAGRWCPADRRRPVGGTEPRRSAGLAGRRFSAADGLGERPQGRRAAVVEFGLPYAADPAISRHLAAFLARARRRFPPGAGRTGAGGPSADAPDAVLLNGGVFHGAALVGRLLELLGGWRGEPLRRLDNPEPDLAVARGAVAYGLARRGRGLRIGGGSARGYFLVGGR